MSLASARDSRALRVAFLLLSLLWGCASASAVGPVHSAPRSSIADGSDSVHAEVVRHAESMIGVPYRYGGSTPTGFDCSGLVVYRYGKAGITGLPRSASRLQERAEPITLARLRPGDLLFFELKGGKTSHVAIYVGGREFVHAPSEGKRVERLSFDHVYWREKLRRAGRLLREPNAERPQPPASGVERRRKPQTIHGVPI